MSGQDIDGVGGCERPRYNYLLSFDLTPSGKYRFVERRGYILSVNPPQYNLVDDDMIAKCLKRCTEWKCALVNLWEDEKVGLNFMAEHLCCDHPSHVLVRDEP